MNTIKFEEYFQNNYNHIVSNNKELYTLDRILWMYEEGYVFTYSNDKILFKKEVS